MVNSINAQEIYYKAVANFGKLDAQDGQTDDSISLQKEGKKYAKADLDGDKKVSLGEFVIFELQRDPALAQQFIYFRKVALAAKWDEAKINLFIGMLFDGAGDGILAVMQEINSYLYFDEKWGIRTLFRIGALEYKDKQGQQVNYLNLIKASPESANKKIVYLMNLVALVSGHYQSYMIDGDNELARKKLISLLGKIGEFPLESRQQRRLLWASVSCYSREGMGLEIFGSWQKEIAGASFAREQDGDFVFWAIAVKLVKTPAQLKELLALIKDLPAWKTDILTKLLRSKAIKSLDELKEIASLLNENDSGNVIGVANYDGTLPSVKEAGIILALINYLQQKEGDAAKKALAYIGQINDEAVRWEVVLQYTARGMGIQRYELESILLGELEKEIPKEDAGLSEISAFLKKIPTCSLYEMVEGLDSYAGKKSQWVKKYPDKIPALLAHVFMQDEKNNYSAVMSTNLEAQGITMGEPTDKKSFKALIEIIDYNQMTTYKMDAKYYMLGKNRALVSVDVFGKQIYKIIDPNNTAEMRQLTEDIYAIEFPDLDKNEYYAAGYFPRITFGDNNQHSVTVDYIAGKEPNKAGEKKTSKDPLSEAYKVFTGLFQKEGAMIQEETGIWESLLPKESLQVYLWNESPIARENLNAIIEIMGNQGAFATTLETFSISEQTYQKYVQGILDLLAQASQGRWQLTREEFLLKAIEVCDGNVMLASVVAYNVLWERKWTFLKEYPDAFSTAGLDDPVTGLDNAGGAIYHFYGLFFAAYAVQVSIVDRYQNDEQFRQEIDAEASAFQKNIKLEGNKVVFEITINKTTYPVKIDLLTQKLEFPAGITKGQKNLLLFEMLLYLQYQMMRKDGGNGREIISLFGTFYEQMIEDGGDAEDFPGDFKGMAAGQAFFQMVHGKELEIKDDNRAVIVRFLGKYVGANSQFNIGDAMALLDLLAPDLKGKIIKIIWGKVTNLFSK